MQKQFYIDGAHLILTGGEITDESSIQRDELVALLPAAVNYGVQAGIWEQYKLEHDFDVPGAFVGTFEDIDVDVTDPDEPFFLLPKTVLAISSDRGIRMVYTPKGNQVYQRMSDNLFSNWGYYKNIMIDQRFFRAGDTKVKLFNKPLIEGKVNINMIVSTEDYDDDAQLPVPVGQETRVIAQLVALFREQRHTITDKVIDKTDIN